MKTLLLLTLLLASCTTFVPKQFSDYAVLTYSCPKNFLMAQDEKQNKFCVSDDVAGQPRLTVSVIVTGKKL